MAKKKIRARARTGIAGVPLDKGFRGLKHYFHAELDKKILIEVLKDYIKANYKKEEFKFANANPEYNFFMYTHYNAAAYALNCGVDFEPPHENYPKSLGRFIRNLIDRGKEIIRKKKSDVDPVVGEKKVVSPHDRLRMKIKSTIIADIENLEDAWMSGSHKASLDLYVQFQAHRLPNSAVQPVREYVQALHDEYYDAYYNKKGECAEGFAHVERKYIRKRIDLTAKMLSDLDRIKAQATAQRKPRIKKPKTADKQVTRLKYLQSSAEWKLTSVNPVTLVGAIRLYTFNAKTRMLTEYVASDAKGFEVNGSTLKNLDEKACRETRLRKPEEFLIIVQSKTPLQINRAWKQLTTKTNQPNGRINKDTILVRTMEK